MNKADGINETNRIFLDFSARKLDLPAALKAAWTG
jgi:hypothetical protein